MAATDEWQAAERHADYLLTGTRLASSNLDRRRIGPDHGPQREFITAGLERRSAEQEAERSRVEAEHRLERRARTRLAGARRCDRARGRRDRLRRSGPASSTETPHVALLHSGLGQIDAITEAGFDRAVSEFGLVGEDLLIDDFSNTAAELRALSEGGADLVVIGDAGPGAEEVAARVSGNEVRLRLSGRGSAERLVHAIGRQPELLSRRGRGGAEVADRHDRFRGRRRRMVHLAVPRRLRGRRAVGRSRHRGALRVPRRVSGPHRVRRSGSSRGGRKPAVRSGRRRRVPRRRRLGRGGLRSGDDAVHG